MYNSKECYTEYVIVTVKEPTFANEQIGNIYLMCWPRIHKPVALAIEDAGIVQ